LQKKKGEGSAAPPQTLDPEETPGQTKKGTKNKKRVPSLGDQLRKTQGEDQGRSGP